MVVDNGFMTGERAGMEREFWDAVEENPIIAAVKSMDDLEEVLQALQTYDVVFILFGDICSIGDIVQEGQGCGQDCDGAC